jgi:hypothetical protein
MLKMEVAYASTASVNSLIHFPAHNIRLTPKPSAPLERTCNFCLETTWKHLVFMLPAKSPLVEHGVAHMYVHTYLVKAC